MTIEQKNSFDNFNQLAGQVHSDVDRLKGENPDKKLNVNFTAVTSGGREFKVKVNVGQEKTQDLAKLTSQLSQASRGKTQRNLNDGKTTFKNYSASIESSTIIEKVRTAVKNFISQITAGFRQPKGEQAKAVDQTNNFATTPSLKTLTEGFKPNISETNLKNEIHKDIKGQLHKNTFVRISPGDNDKPSAPKSLSKILAEIETDKKSGDVAIRQQFARDIGCSTIYINGEDATWIPTTDQDMKTGEESRQSCIKRTYDQIKNAVGEQAVENLALLLHQGTVAPSTNLLKIPDCLASGLTISSRITTDHKPSTVNFNITVIGEEVQILTTNLVKVQNPETAEEQYAAFTSITTMKKADLDRPLSVTAVEVEGNEPDLTGDSNLEELMKNMKVEAHFSRFCDTVQEALTIFKEEFPPLK